MDCSAVGTSAMLIAYSIFPPPIPYVLSVHSPTFSPALISIKFDSVRCSATKGAYSITILLVLIVVQQVRKSCSSFATRAPARFLILLVSKSSIWGGPEDKKGFLPKKLEGPRRPV